VTRVDHSHPRAPLILADSEEPELESAVAKPATNMWSQERETALYRELAPRATAHLPKAITACNTADPLLLMVVLTQLRAGDLLRGLYQR
jgi:hypothetical protein